MAVATVPESSLSVYAGARINGNRSCPRRWLKPSVIVNFAGAHCACIIIIIIINIIAQCARGI